MDSTKMLRWVLPFIMASFPPIMQAQDYMDLVNVSYATTPPNDFEMDGQSTRVEQLNAQVDIPLVINENSVFLTGLSAQTNTLLLDPSFSDKSTIGLIAFKLGLNLVHSKKLSGTYMVIPKLASDFGAVQNKDFQVGVLALLNLKKTERFSYKFGMFFNTEKFGLFVTPLLGFYYKSRNENFEMNFTLPASADMNYRIFENTFAGLYFESLSGSFYLNNAFVANTSQYLNKSSNDIYIYLGIPITKSLILRPKIGYTIGRNYRTFDENDKVSVSISSIYLGDNRTQLNQDFKNGLVAKLELLYRFHFKK